MKWLQIPFAPERRRNKVTKFPSYFFMMAMKRECEREGKWSEKNKMELSLCDSLGRLLADIEREVARHMSGTSYRSSLRRWSSRLLIDIKQ